MFFEPKMKKQNVLKFIWFPMVLLVTFFTTLSLFGPRSALFAVSGIFLIVAILPLLTFIRTRNPGQLVLTLYIFSAALVCISAPAAIEDKSNKGFVPLFLVILYALMLVVIYLTVNRKLRWRGEEVFELAAMPVEDIGDSFTARPRPAGQVQVSKTEMIRFVDFMSKNLVAFPFKEENRVIFVLTLPGKDLPYLLGIKKDYLEDTWVAVDYEGNITVNITEEDYLLFKMDLDFDQVCQSLGDVFSEFLELSKKGQEDKIIDRMNALRLNPIN